MSLRMPLLQIMMLIVGLMIASFLAIPGLSAALAEVRLLLVMVLGVATLYLGILQRRTELEVLPVVPTEVPEHTLERGR